MLPVLVFMAHSAQAIELVPTSALPLPPDPTAIAIAAGPYLVAASQEEVWVVDPADGAILSEIALGGQSLLVRDHDSDGVEDIVLCGEQGLWWVGNLLSPTKPAQLTDEPCEAVAFHSLGGIDGYATATSEISIWDLAGVARAIYPEVSLSGPPIIGSTTTAIIAAGVGEDTIHKIGIMSTEPFSVKGTLSWFEAGGDAIFWSLSDGSEILLEGFGTFWQVSDGPGRFWMVEADGDELTDLYIHYPDVNDVVLHRGSGQPDLWLDHEGDVGPIASSDLDADGCSDLVVVDLDEGEAGVWLVDRCGLDLDRDGDGFSLEDGDCDDENATVYPDAEELCDGLDNDCNGEIDELELSLDAVLEINGAAAKGLDETMDEGGELELIATTTSCEEDVSITWEVDADGILTCSNDGDSRLVCAVIDDGIGMIIVTVSHAGGAEQRTITALINVSNVAPVLDSASFGCDGISDGEVRAKIGRTYEETLTAEDPGADEATFAQTGAPPGLVLSPAGDFTYSPVSSDEGSWSVTITVSDEDGGKTLYPFELVVEDNDLDFCGDSESSISCCGSTCGGTAMIATIGLLGAGLRRREG